MMSQVELTGGAMYPIKISFLQLRDKEADLSDKIREGFGPNGLGIISITDVPGFGELRKKLLQLAPKFDRLPEEALKKIEDPESMSNNGWSSGKEKLDSGKLATFKGSFCANPTLDVATSDASDLKRYPWFCNPNKWPGEDMPDLKAAFKDLGKLMLEVGYQVAYHCDKYLEGASKHNGIILEDIIRRSRCQKGRLMHYRSNKQSQYGDDANKMASWCKWHCDYSILTGLAPAIYTKGDDVVPCPDDIAGLYVKTRDNQIVRVEIAEDEIAYQLGITAEILLKGQLCATPHCVQAPGEKGFDVARSSFALFIQPDWDEMLAFPDEITTQKELVSPKEVVSFGEFLARRMTEVVAVDA